MFKKVIYLVAKILFSNPQISRSRLKTQNRKIWKKGQNWIKSNIFKIIKINLEVWKFNEIYLRYISTKLFNRIIRFSWRTLILLLELKYFRRNLIIFVISWNFRKLKPKVIQ